MEPLAFSAINAWNRYVKASHNPNDLIGLIAVTFDQRNHGSREVDPRANQDWRSGNRTHAQDMFANYRSSSGFNLRSALINRFRGHSGGRITVD